MPLLFVLLEPEPGVFLSQSETFLLPVSCALTAGVDGGFHLKGELQGGHSSLRFWPEESVQFQNNEMKGELGHSGQRRCSSLRCWQEKTEPSHDGVSGQRSRSSLRRWKENTVPFHEPETKGEMIGSRRRRRRGGCFAEARSGSDLDVSHSFDLSSVRVESPLSRVQRVTAALHGHHNACDTHNSQNSYSVHGACVEFGEFVGKHRSWETTLLCTWGNRVTEYEYSVRGQAFCCV